MTTIGRMGQTSAVDRSTTPDDAKAMVELMGNGAVGDTSRLNANRKALALGPLPTREQR